jgi:hypothetical protein
VEEWAKIPAIKAIAAAVGRPILVFLSIQGQSLQVTTT